MSKKENIFIKHSVSFIETYQRYLSPDHSALGKKKHPYGYCRYHPTCSEYTKLSIQKHGFIKGWIKGIYRILKCNPCSKGGIDNP